MKLIPHNKQCIDEAEIAAVTRVLQKEWLIAGEMVDLFEENFKEYVGAPYAVTVNSGTSALHLSLLALGVQEEDEVIIPTYTASDLLNAISYVGAKPILIDIAKDSCNIDLIQIPKKITAKTKVMIIPHTFGFPTDIEQLYQYKIPIIEDCAQTIGSMLHDRRVGTFGMISIFSFFATKLLTTGQGGMVVTRNKKIYEYIKDAIDYNGRDNYKVRYNYPMTDIAASIGNSQLKKYPGFAEKRKHIAHSYQKVLEAKSINHYPKKSDTHVVPFRFLLQCTDEKNLAFVQQTFRQQGIEVKQPIAEYELLHRLLHEDDRRFLRAERFAKSVLSLAIYPCLSDTDIERIVGVLSSSL